MSMIFEARKDMTSEMNVTPLIDVLLVLLIISMILLPHHNQGEQADIPQPNKDEAQVPYPDLIVIQLHDTGDSSLPTLKINQQEVTWEGLEARLRDIYKTRMERVAFLKGDPEIDFEYVAQALDIAHHAGVDRIGLMGAKD